METEQIKISQRVAVLIDGNNIGKGIRDTKEWMIKDKQAMLNYKTFIPRILKGRGLSRMYYFREGNSISSKFENMLHEEYFGVVVPCGESADMELAITATEIAEKIDVIILLSGDGDFLPLLRHLRTRGVRTEVIAVKNTAHRHIIDNADYYSEITKDDIFYFKPKENHN